MRTFIICALLSGSALAQTPTLTANIAARALRLHQVTAQDTTYKGHKATRIDDAAPTDAGDAGRLAIVDHTTFTDGVIDLDVSGDTAPDADPIFRGFVGLAFRLGGSNIAANDASHFECFYLRPKNGRSLDPAQRGHAAQYISIPGFPWQKLRSETPGKYEASVDLVPGEWTHIHLVVSGETARLFVNGASTPTLTVTDLKQPITPGALALWIGSGTIAHFANLSYTPSEKH